MAARKLTAITYDADVHAEGDLAAQYPRMTGKVTIARGASDQTHKVAIRATTLSPGASQSSTFSFAFDGLESAQCDDAAKVFTHGRPAEMSLQISHPLYQPRYMQEDPFKDLLENPAVRYEGLTTVQGTEFHAISLPLKGPGGATARLYFDKTGFLLRRQETSILTMTRPGAPPVSGTIVFAAENLDVAPKIDEAIFRLTCPEGYEKKPLTPPPQPGQPSLLAVGSEAPNWELKDSEGRTVTLKGLRGKVVLLDFWATWCGPCKMAMPGLQKLHERFKDKAVVIYGVNCRELDPKSDPMAFIRKQGYTYGQLLRGDSVASAYRVDGIPCFYLIGPDGKILHAGSGFNPQLEALIAQMIDKALTP